jgi:hypothetical protein
MLSRLTRPSPQVQPYLALLIVVSLIGLIAIGLLGQVVVRDQTQISEQSSAIGIAKQFAYEMGNYDYQKLDNQQSRLKQMALPAVLAKVKQSYSDVLLLHERAIAKGADFDSYSFSGSTAQVTVFTTGSFVTESLSTSGNTPIVRAFRTQVKRVEGSWKVYDFDPVNPSILTKIP